MHNQSIVREKHFQRYFVLAIYSWGWILAPRVACVLGETLLEKTYFLFVSSYKLEIV